MKKANTTFAIAMGLFLCAPAMAGHESNGGDEVKSNFITWARVIHASIQGNAEDAKILTAQQETAFGQAIETTDVEPIVPTGPFTDNEGNIVDARVVDDPLHIGQKRIELDQNFWQAASPEDPGVCRLVFHEYLRVIGVDDQTDEDRNAVSYQWHDVCDYYTADAIRNPDFELSPQAGQIPVGWIPVGTKSYTFTTDLTVFHKGAASGRISQVGVPGPNDFGGFAQCVPAAPFIGNGFRLTGFLKLLAVENGFAGLWARVDDVNGATLAFDNMQDRGLAGTRDWTPAIVDLAVPAGANRICFGGVFGGTGTVWFDDLAVTQDN